MRRMGNSPASAGGDRSVRNPWRGAHLIDMRPEDRLEGRRPPEAQKVSSKFSMVT